MPTPRDTTDRRSALYTSKQAQARKIELIRDWGKDSDGAYRTRKRIDGKDKKPE